jgi:hypothetical protein
MQSQAVSNGELFSITLKRKQTVCHIFNKGSDYIQLRVGTYVMKRIPDPTKRGHGDWLVLSDEHRRGKIIGGAEIFWKNLSEINPHVEIEKL